MCGRSSIQSFDDCRCRPAGLEQDSDDDDYIPTQVAGEGQPEGQVEQPVIAGSTLKCTFSAEESISAADSDDDSLTLLSLNTDASLSLLPKQPSAVEEDSSVELSLVDSVCLRKEQLDTSQHTTVTGLSQFGPSFRTDWAVGGQPGPAEDPPSVPPQHIVILGWDCQDEDDSEDDVMYDWSDESSFLSSKRNNAERMEELNPWG